MRRGWRSAVKAVELVWQLGHCSYPRAAAAVGGSFAVEGVRDRLSCVTKEIEDQKHLGCKRDGECGGGEGSGDPRDEGRFAARPFCL